MLLSFCFICQDETTKNSCTLSINEIFCLSQFTGDSVVTGQGLINGRICFVFSQVTGFIGSFNILSVLYSYQKFHCTFTNLGLKNM